MNKSESKYFSTAVKMDEALLSLLEKKDFQYITVKEICDEAGVNRSTFYLHYETVGDILSESIEYIMNRFNEKFSSFETITAEQIANTPTDELILVTPRYLVPYLEFVKENRRIFKIAVTQPGVIRANKIFGLFYSDIFYPIMKRFGLAESEIKYKLTFYIHGMFAVISKWIVDECDEEVESLASILVRCVFPEGDMCL